MKKWNPPRGVGITWREGTGKGSGWRKRTTREEYEIREKIVS